MFFNLTFFSLHLFVNNVVFMSSRVEIINAEIQILSSNLSKRDMFYGGYVKEVVFSSEGIRKGYLLCQNGI